MPHFGNHSLTQLDTVDERVAALFFEVIDYRDCRIIEGHRGEERQNAMCDSDPPRSHVRWPHGLHNATPSKALDATPWPIDWDDTRRLYLFSGFVLGVAVRMGIPIRCGADWEGDGLVADQGFHDVGHFELI